MHLTPGASTTIDEAPRQRLRNRASFGPLPVVMCARIRRNSRVSGPAWAKLQLDQGQCFAVAEMLSAFVVGPHPRQMVGSSGHAMRLEHDMERSHRDVLGSDVRLRIYEQGPLEANVVVCLHGLFADARAFLSIASQLSDEYRVVCPDLPGHGDSEKPPTSRFAYSVEAFANALVQLYGGLGIRRAAIVGHGLGGSIAIDLAARHPELVTRLVLIDAICRPSPLFFAQRAILLPVVGGIVFKQLLGRTAFRALFRERLFGNQAAIPNSRIDAYFDAFNSPAGRGSILATLRATADTRAVLAQTVRLNLPTLVIWGRHDRFQPASVGQRLSREIRNAGFELLNAGHSPHEECPEQLGPSLRRFLRAERL